MKMLTIYRPPPRDDPVGSDEMVIPAGKPYLTKVSGKLVMARNKKDKPFQRGFDLFTRELLNVPVSTRSKSVPPTTQPLIIGEIPYYPHQPHLQSACLPQPQPLLLPQMMQPASIMVRLNHDVPELTQQDFDKLVKFNAHFTPIAKEAQKQRSEESKKTKNDEVSTQNSIKITVHACAKCGRIRSRKYHHEHPMNSAELPPPNYCRKCQRDSSSSSSSERIPQDHRKKHKSKSNGKKIRRRHRKSVSSSSEESSLLSDYERKEKVTIKKGRSRSSPAKHIVTIEEEVPRREEERGRRGRPSKESRNEEGNGKTRAVSPLHQHDSARTRSTVKVKVHEQRKERRQDSPRRKRSPSIVYQYVQASRRDSSQHPQASQLQGSTEEVPQTRGCPLSDYYRYVQVSHPQSRQPSQSSHTQDFGQETRQTLQRPPSPLYHHVPVTPSQPRQRAQSSHAQYFKRGHREVRERSLSPFYQHTSEHPYHYDQPPAHTYSNKPSMDSLVRRSSSNQFDMGEDYDDEVPIPVNTSTKKGFMQFHDEDYLRDLNEFIPLPPTPVKQSPRRAMQHWASRENKYDERDGCAECTQPGVQNWGSADDLENMLSPPSQPATKQKVPRHFVSQENVMDNLDKLFATSDEPVPERRARERARRENDYDCNRDNSSGSPQPLHQQHTSKWENYSDDCYNDSIRPSQPLHQPKMRQRERRQNSYEDINDASASSREASGRRRRERRSQTVPNPRWGPPHQIRPDNNNQTVVVTETYVYKPARQIDEERQLRKRADRQSLGSKRSLDQLSEKSEAARYYQNDWAVRPPVSTTRPQLSRNDYRRHVPTDPSLADTESIYKMERCDLPWAPTPPSESGHSHAQPQVWDWSGLDEAPYSRSSASEQTIRHDKAYTENRQHRSLSRHIPRPTSSTSRQSSRADGKQWGHDHRTQERIPSPTDFRRDNYWTDDVQQGSHSSRDRSAEPETPSKHVTFQESGASRNGYSQSDMPVFPKYSWGDDTGVEIPPQDQNQNQGDGGWGQNSGADNSGSGWGDDAGPSNGAPVR